MTKTSSEIDPVKGVSAHDLKACGMAFIEQAPCMKTNQIQRREMPRRMLSVLWIRQKADNGAPESLTPNRQDAYIVGWGLASGIATVGLSVLIGASAFGLALIFAGIARWQLIRSTRRIPERVWWYCWMVLMSAGVGLAVYDAHLR